MNSIFNKINILSDFLLEYNLDIFGVAETWLLLNTPDSFVSIQDYSVVRSDTPGNTRKHGVCMYLKNHINFISILADCSNVCIAHLLDFNLYVLVIYRPPSYTHTDNVQLVQFLLNFCPSKEVLIVGDFNLPDIPWHLSDAMAKDYTPLCKLFMDVFISLSLLING